MEVNTFVVKYVGWTEAIRDAESQLRDAENRVIQLRDVIEVFKLKEADGEPWPEEPA